MTPKKILIIYSQTGGGHLSLAIALEQALRQFLIFPTSAGRNSQFSISLVDPFPRLYARGYKSLGASFQNLWGRNYNLTNHPEAAEAIHTLNYLLVGPRLVKILAQEEPDLIISTSAFATVEVEKALRKLTKEAKIAVLIADPFTPHEVWFTYKNADLYLSPTWECSHQARTAGLAREKVKTVGWLVRNSFHDDLAETKNLRKTLGLVENKFTLLLGGSGQGGGKIWELAKLLSQEETLAAKAQTVVVAGRNRSLLNKLARLAEDRPGFFHLFAQVNNMPQLLDAADLVVGKAGPNLLFEAIFRERPFLATGLLPGQEDGNLEFIKRENLGWVEENLGKAVELISELVNHKERLEEKIPNLQRIKREHRDANQKSAKAIQKLLS